MFYDIPCVCNMIAAHQLDFIRKTVCGPSDRPAQQMLTKCCDTVCRIGRPFLHNKDNIVKNLRLLFANVPEVTIDKYGSLKHWIKKASHKQYWSQLVKCLTHRHAAIPVRPDKWPQPRISFGNHDAPPPQTNNPFPPHHLKQTEQECQIPQQRQRVNKDRLPQHPHVPHRHSNNDPRPHPLHRRTAVEITYLSNWGEASLTPSKYLVLDWGHQKGK
jgi:hypothetical protein